MWTACSAGQPLLISHLCGYLQALTLPPDQRVSSRMAAIHAKHELESHLSNKIDASDVGLCSEKTLRYGNSMCPLPQDSVQQSEFLPSTPKMRKSTNPSEADVDKTLIHYFWEGSLPHLPPIQVEKPANRRRTRAKIRFKQGQCAVLQQHIIS